MEQAPRYHAPMADIAMLCADGSEASVVAIRSGMALLGADTELVMATVIDAADPMLVTGTGFAGGTMAAEELANHEAANEARAHELATSVAADLGCPGAATVVLRGDPGVAICRHAEEIGAAVIVLGTRGHGGLRRAVLGSVSDYVVRHATCPVLVTSPRN